MTTEKQAPARFATVIRRFRWVYLAPVLAFVALSAWSFASPIGAGPDDDYHLVSIWCSSGGGELCAPGSDDGHREVAEGFPQITCYAQEAAKSADCQQQVWSSFDDSTVEIDRGNFLGEYPPVYYSVMHLFAGSDIQVSALVMRLLNAALFVALGTALAVLLPSRRRTMLWAWLVTLVPLGMFLIPSNNPSGWAITGVGTAYLALLGWFEATGRRRWVLGALYLLGVLMAAGSRGDAAVYIVGATVVVLILTAARTRPWLLSAILPAVGLIVGVVLMVSAGQSGVASSGFTSDGSTSPVLPGHEADAGASGLALAAYNLLMLPFLWTGVWGTWALGWFDTGLPAIVPWAAVAAFVVVAFAGLGQLTWRKAVSVAGVLFVLIALPVYVLTAGGDTVGVSLQPRYLLPLIVLFAFVLLTEPAGGVLRFTRVQTFAILGALALANLVSLQVNIRRYITGSDQQGFNLDAGAEWWWTGFPVGPTAVWVIGVVAYVALLVLLWAQLRPATVVAERRPVSTAL
jgi:hypothetical protein